MIFAMYLVVAEQHGADWKKISGTLQNDILKEYIAAEGVRSIPPRRSMRLVIDTFEFCSKHVPKWNTISVSGYHIREAGSTALQELAFTLRDGLEYVQYGMDAGLEVDDFVPRISFFFNAHNDFFEEIAKYRAARKLWAEAMRGPVRREEPAVLALRFHTQTAGVSLTAQQPSTTLYARRCRRSRRCSAARNSLHTNSLTTKRWRCPRGKPRLIALRTQQIIADETGVTNTVDPLGGLYFVEKLTGKMEEGTWIFWRTSTGWAVWSKRSSEATRRKRSPRPRTSSSRPSSAARRRLSASTTS